MCFNRAPKRFVTGPCGSTLPVRRCSSQPRGAHPRPPPRTRPRRARRSPAHSAARPAARLGRRRGPCPPTRTPSWLRSARSQVTASRLPPPRTGPPAHARPPWGARGGGRRGGGRGTDTGTGTGTGMPALARGAASLGLRGSGARALCSLSLRHRLAASMTRSPTLLHDAVGPAMFCR